MIEIDLRTKRKKKATEGIESKLAFIQALKYKEALVAIVGVLAIGVSMLYIVFLSFKEKELTEKKEYLIEEKKKLQAVERKIKALKQEIKRQEKIKKQLALRKEILEELSKRKSNVKEILVGVGVSIPEGIWLDNIRISNENINLNGYTFNPENIYNFFTNLKERYPDFKLSTLGKARFCNLRNKKEFILCIEKEKKNKSSINYYRFSINLKNLKSGEEIDKGRN